MDFQKFPINESEIYPITSPVNIYMEGFQLLSQQLKRTETYRDAEVGSAQFTEFVFWRKNLIIWTCCTIESFVNLEGVSYMGEEFYKDTIERRNIVQKIRLIISIKKKELIKPDNKILKDVKSVFELRNQFVHPKTRSFNKDSYKSNNNIDTLIAQKPTKLKKLIQEVNGLISNRTDRV